MTAALAPRPSGRGAAAPQTLANRPPPLGHNFVETLQPAEVFPSMQNQSLEPRIAAKAPASSTLTPYDRQHLVTYLRLLDAEKDDADWREAARIVLHLDCDQDADRAHEVWASHLARAHWLCQHGYRQLVDDARDNH